MNYQDFIISPPKKKYEKWQLGAQLAEDLPENGVAILVITDYRGSDIGDLSTDFGGFRDQLYVLSGSYLNFPLFDFGNLISGKTHDDTHYILQEILSSCHYKKTIPIIIGGSSDFSFSLFSALNFHQKNINFTQIANVIQLTDDGNTLDENNYLPRLFSSKNFSLKNYALLGYQKHLNDADNIKLTKEVDFDVHRLADMIGNVAQMEPYFRNAHLVSINADAVESGDPSFSVNPQINGLNKREICAYMKEAGISSNLQSMGIFNINLNSKNILNNQLLAQMIWYALEGISIQKEHPKEQITETFYVLAEDEKYTFKKDVFTNLWYFGESENLEYCLPCSLKDYEDAKKGLISSRLHNFNTL